MAETRICSSGVAHVFDPDSHFCCKMKYWRENGTPGVAYAGGRENFHGSTVRERVEDNLKRARANGLDPQPVGTRWV